ncbi:prefoldin subunit 4-like [Haliotis cracherodii]|uniref:prefoldin subunit 4-like n=1 Tax=Haliotis rufescens TaxID=6454 RepID=UPI001EAF9D8B|nr:prefoldin subunit 4-like [Haliotis rufescens]
MATLKDSESDAQVTFEDQQKINKFARHNAKLQDIKEELTTKKKDLQNLEDAADELMLQDGDDGAIPYQIGEVFVSSTVDEANEMIEKAKENTQKAIEELEERAETHKKVLSDLKVQLYAKFGNNINLEAEDD